jgi:hypothetical protein
MFLEHNSAYCCQFEFILELIVDQWRLALTLPGGSQGRRDRMNGCGASRSDTQPWARRNSTQPLRVHYLCRCVVSPGPQLLPSRNTVRLEPRRATRREATAHRRRHALASADSLTGVLSCPGTNCPRCCGPARTAGRSAGRRRRRSRGGPSGVQGPGHRDSLAKGLPGAAIARRIQLDGERGKIMRADDAQGGWVGRWTAVHTPTPASWTICQVAPYFRRTPDSADGWSRTSGNGGDSPVMAASKHS